MSKRRKPFNVIVKFQEGEPSQEEQTKALFKFMAVVLEGYKTLLEKNHEAVTEEDKNNIKDCLPLLPCIKRIAEKRENNDNLS